MKSSAIQTRLAAIKDTSGSKAKKSLLEMLRDDHPDSAEVMRRVFDVNTTFGFNKKIPNPATPAPGRVLRLRDFNQATDYLLDALASRELTGDRAKAAVALELGRLNKPSRDLLVCILQQNLRAGFGIDVVVDVYGPIVETFDICLAQEWTKHKGKVAKDAASFNPKKHIGHYPMWLDVKYDGLRGVRFQHEEVLYSRKKLPLTCPASLMSLMTEFLEEAHLYFGPGQYEQLVMDVEVVAVDGIFRDAISNARASKKGAKENSLCVKIIDLITSDELEAGKSILPQRERRAQLQRMLEQPQFKRFFPYIAMTEGKEVANEEEADEYFGECLERGLEGYVGKVYEGFWENKRSFYWLKRKAENQVRGRIIGYEMADPLSKYAGMVGAVWFQLDSGAKVKASGMTDDMRAYITENQEALIDQVTDLFYHELTPDGSLRHPRIGDLEIKALRTDRP